MGRLAAVAQDKALAIALGREWLARGLTLSGGKNGGDGLDVFLEAIIGNRKDAEDAIAAARRELKGPCQ